MTRRRRIAMRILTGLVVYNFVAAAVIKLIGARFAVEEFRRFGYPQQFRIEVAVVELMAALLLLVPRTAPLATAVLSLILVGAVGSHWMAHQLGMSCLPLLLLAILSVTSYLRWGGTR